MSVWKGGIDLYTLKWPFFDTCRISSPSGRSIYGNEGPIRALAHSSIVRASIVETLCEITGRSPGSNRWRYVSTICLAIWIVGIFPYIGLKYRPYIWYLQFRFLKWPLMTLPICSMYGIFTYKTGWFLGQMLVNIPYMEHMGYVRWAFHKWGCRIPNSSLVGLFHGKSERKMDDDWGYHHDSGNLQMIHTPIQLFETCPIFKSLSI